MTLFQGYARRSSVAENTIKVEDPSEKILAESRRTLQQWRARSSQEQASRDQYLGKLRENFNKEQAVRDSNRRLEKEFAENWKDARAKNWEITINNLEGEAKNAQPPMLQQLAELAPSLAKNWQVIDDKRRADGRRLGLELGWDHGVSMKDVWAQDKIKNGQLANDDASANAYQKGLRDRGVPEDVIARLGRLSGYQRLGIMEADLVRGAQNFEAWYWQQMNRELELTGGFKASLGSAMQSENYQQLLPMVQRRLKSEYLSKFKGYNQALVQKHLRDPIVKTQGRMISATIENQRKHAKEEFKQNIERDLKTQIAIDSVEGYLGFVKRHEGLNGEHRKYANDLAYNTLVGILESGHGNEEFVQRLLEYEYVPHGEKKTVKWGERNWRKADGIRTALRKGHAVNTNKSNQDIANQEALKKAQAFDVQTYITANYGNISDADYGKMFQIAVQAGNKQAQDKIDSARNVRPSAINDKFNVPGLQQLYNNNMLTMSAVMNAKLTPSAEGEWIEKAKEQDKTKPSDEIDKVFDETAGRAVQGILKRYGTESKDVQSSSLAKADMVNSLRKYYKKHIIATNNPNASRDAAISELNADIANKKYEITERRSIDGKLIQDPHFTNFQLQASRSPYHMSKLREKVRENPNMWKEEVIIPAVQKIQWAHNVAAGMNKGFPAGYTHFVNNIMGRNPDGTTKVTEAEVARHQLQLLLGEKKAKELIPDELFDIARQAEGFIEEEFRKLLCYGPQGIACATHYSKQTRANNYKPKKVDGNYNTFSSGSLYRQLENFSPHALYWLKKPEKQYAHPVLKEREENPGPLGSRSNPWPKGTPYWQIAGFKNEAEYEEAVKKNPEIRGLIEYE